MNKTIQNSRKPIIQKLKDYLFEDKAIIFAYLHGSFLTQGQFSDIDVALYIDELTMPNIKPLDFEIELALKLEEIVKFSVDVKILNSAILSFRYQASCGSLLFSRDEIKREEFLCRTWSEYFDFLPMAKVYLREVLSA